MEKPGEAAGGARALMQDNLALKQRVSRLESNLKQTKDELSIVSASREQLAKLLELTRAERDELRYSRRVLEGAVQRQHSELADARAQLRDVQGARAREHASNARLVALSERGPLVEVGPQQRRRQRAGELSMLMCASEAELALTQQTCKLLQQRTDAAESQKETLRKRVAQLEQTCYRLDTENNVAVDFLLRLEANKDNVSNNGRAAPSTPGPTPASPGYVVTPINTNGTSNYRLSSDLASSHVSALTRTEFNSDDVVTDPVVVAGHVKMLAQIFSEKGISFPVTKRLGTDERPGQDTEDCWYQIRRGKDPVPRPVQLAILDGLLVVDQGDDSYVDLLQVLVDRITPSP